MSTTRCIKHYADPQPSLGDLKTIAQAAYDSLEKPSTEAARHAAAEQAAATARLDLQRTGWLTEIVDSMAQNEATRYPAPLSGVQPD